MTIDELYKKYSEDYKRNSEEYKVWYDIQKANLLGSRSGKISDKRDYFPIDYDFYERELIIALKQQFSISDAQANYIYSKAYERYHAHYGEVFYGAQNIAELVLGYPA